MTRAQRTCLPRRLSCRPPGLAALRCAGSARAEANLFALVLIGFIELLAHVSHRFLSLFLSAGRRAALARAQRRTFSQPDKSKPSRRRQIDRTTCGAHPNANQLANERAAPPSTATHLAPGELSRWGPRRCVRLAYNWRGLLERLRWRVLGSGQLLARRRRLQLLNNRINQTCCERLTAEPTLARESRSAPSAAAGPLASA